MTVPGSPPAVAHVANSPRRSRVRFAAGAALALYLALAIGLSFTRIPICDEGWYASPALELITTGGMGSPVLESAGSYLTGIERYTYWIMPLHAIIEAPWFAVFGPRLIVTRMLSVIAGLAALLCWFLVVRKITGQNHTAVMALLLMAVDSNVLVLGSTGRSDMLSAAFGAGALTSYLLLRERHLGWALFAGHACAAASGLTHPNGGLVALPSILFLQLYFDRRRLEWKHLGAMALPYAIGGGAWFLYILRSPANFLAQFGGNAAGRLWGFGSPLLALKLEITGRFLPAYGFVPEANHIGKLHVIVLVLYMAAIASLWGSRSLRRTPAGTITGILIAIVMFVLLFLEGAKQPWYLLHLSWLLAAAVAICYEWHSRRHPGWRPALRAMLAVLILLQTGYAAVQIVQRKYDSIYRPVIALLQHNLRPGQFVIGSAELAFGLGFQRVLDDANLGYYSGKQPDFLVTDNNYRVHLADLARTRPAIYTSLAGILRDAYQPVYSNSGYTVYARNTRFLAGHRVILQSCQSGTQAINTVLQFPCLPSRRAVP